MQRTVQRTKVRFDRPTMSRPGGWSWGDLVLRSSRSISVTSGTVRPLRLRKRQPEGHANHRRGLDGGILVAIMTAQPKVCTELVRAVLDPHRSGCQQRARPVFRPVPQTLNAILGMVAAIVVVLTCASGRQEPGSERHYLLLEHVHRHPEAVKKCRHQVIVRRLPSSLRVAPVSARIEASRGASGKKVNCAD